MDGVFVESTELLCTNQIRVIQDETRKWVGCMGGGYLGH